MTPHLSSSCPLAHKASREMKRRIMVSKDLGTWGRDSCAMYGHISENALCFISFFSCKQQTENELMMSKEASIDK